MGMTLKFPNDIAYVLSVTIGTTDCLPLNGDEVFLVTISLTHPNMRECQCMYPDSKFHGANIGPNLGRQDTGGPHVGPINLAIWVG